MYELSKEVLQKVSFDKYLFKKELKKAITWLSKDEIHLFKAYSLTTFGSIYKEEIISTFNQLI